MLIWTSHFLHSALHYCCKGEVPSPVSTDQLLGWNAMIIIIYYRYLWRIRQNSLEMYTHPWPPWDSPWDSHPILLGLFHGMKLLVVVRKLLLTTFSHFLQHSINCIVLKYITVIGGVARFHPHINSRFAWKQANLLTRLRVPKTEGHFGAI